MMERVYVVEQWTFRDPETLGVDMTQNVDLAVAVRAALISTIGLSTRCRVRGVFPCPG